MFVQALGVTLKDDKYWDAPDTFNPARFLPQQKKGEDKGKLDEQWAFRPFGVGNRMCPASKYPRAPSFSRYCNDIVDMH